ncbi:unnamed protein product [Hydatigera taeniaeformis]|uniref:PID domain-containing protein n=1 Tax=Hydatigena taeniaeformis TaxID=6205 RepID=A0A0R3X052_HYDTA|nr:unnamed protein product [Hydatigera taeniaeformis]
MPKSIVLKMRNHLQRAFAWLVGRSQSGPVSAEALHRAVQIHFCAELFNSQMPSVHKEKKKKDNKKGKSAEEPEICLFQIPTFKPKAFKSKDELDDLKNGKPMDIKLFKDGVHFYAQGKKKVKHEIPYNELQDIEFVDGSPELVRLIVNSKGKTTCYQVIVADDVNREKMCEFLREKKGKEHHVSSMGKTEQTVEEPSQSEHKPPPPKNMGFAASDFSKNMSSEMSYNDNTNVHYDPPNKYKSMGLKSGFKSSNMSRNSEAAFDRRSRSTAFNVDYRQEEDDFNSIADQFAQSVHQGYAPSRRYETSSYARSRISYEPDYVDDDYDEQTSGYVYDDSEDSDETIVVRPVKPRSLTFYTPFLKVPRNRGPYN